MRCLIMIFEPAPSVGAVTFKQLFFIFSIMLKNIIAITIRSLMKRKVYTVLNILGLATSIAFAFLLWLYVKDQRSYDRHFANAQRIYRINADFNMNGKRDIYSNAPRPIGPTLKADYPQIAAFARMYGMGGLSTHTCFLEVDKKRVKTTEIFVADSSVFQIFERVFVEGDPATALSEPNSIVLTESLAVKLFGSEPAFGQSLIVQSSRPKTVKVTGVVRDELRNSHIPIEAYISWSTYPYQYEMTQWYGAHTYTYILLNESNNIQALRQKVPEFYEKHMKETFENANGTADLMFQPLTDIHLSKEYVWEPNPHGSETNVEALSLVIVFLLVYAVINYVNLATARAVERAAEVGLRKVLGSPRRFLVYQFIAEAVLLAGFSGVFALLLCSVLLPYFNQLADLQLSLLVLLDLKNVLYVLALSVSIGLFAGLYPAFYLSSLNSLRVLKGKFASSAKGELLRKLLVTSQYIIASVLIASILFVGRQTHYIKNRDIGFDRENIVAVRIPADTNVSRRIKPFVDGLRNMPTVAGVTNTYYELEKEANQFTPTLENADGTTFRTGADLITVDPHFLETIGVQLVAGRNFLQGSEAEEDRSILINEMAVKKFGWEENPLGGKYVGYPDSEGKVTKYQVAGVVKDFSLGVSYQTINPLIIFLNNEGGSTLYIRAAAHQGLNALAAAERKWNDLYPGYGFEVYWLNESLEALYQKEEKFLGLLAAFSFVILFIASLGIFGLISYTTQLRRKEIAIRKVLGSPARSIVMLLSKKFAILLLLANSVALPLTYYLVEMWLDNFSYRIDITAGPFAISVFVCAFFTALSLLYHTMQAVWANPVNALSYE